MQHVIVLICPSPTNRSGEGGRKAWGMENLAPVCQRERNGAREGEVKAVAVVQVGGWCGWSTATGEAGD